MKVFSLIPSILKNKFLLATSAFVIWMLFFDRNDVFTLAERNRELRSLKESKQYYTEEIVHERKVSEELKSSPATIEKYAREKYLMKRENEDLFIIQQAEN